MSSLLKKKDCMCLLCPACGYIHIISEKEFTELTIHYTFFSLDISLVL